jgi:hypothetical protein
MIPLSQGCLLLLVVLSRGAMAEAREQVNPDTGLSSWETVGQDFSLELVQVLPDYVRAVYASRGLPQSIIDKVSSYCVFGTILKNQSDTTLAYNVGDWRYVTRDGRAHRARLKTEWVNEWQDMGVAFRWSLLPEQQTYAPGDWGQGFTTIALPPGTVLDLHYSWEQGGVTHTGIIKEVRCAPAELESQ